MSMNGRYTLFPEIESGASGMLKLDRLHTMYWEEPALHIVTPVSIEVAGTHGEGGLHVRRVSHHD